MNPYNSLNGHIMQKGYFRSWVIMGVSKAPWCVRDPFCVLKRVTAAKLAFTVSEI